MLDWFRLGITNRERRKKSNSFETILCLKQKTETKDLSCSNQSYESHKGLANKFNF